MALTRVSRHIIDDPFNPTAVSATDVTTTNINASGIGTVGTLRVTGDLTVEGTTTTLDSIITEVDRLEVSANSTVAAGIITQTGSGDILNLFDGSTEVFTVTDGGKVGIEAPNPSGNLNISYLQVGKGQVSSDHSLYNYNTSFTNNAYQNGNGTFAHITSRAVGVINIQDNVLTFSNGPGGTAGQSATLTERLRITSDGKVGVGEDNVQAHFHIAKNIADSDAINWTGSQLSVATEISGNSTANRATIYFAPYGSDNNYAPSAISASAGTSGASTLKFFTNTSGNLTGQVQNYERLRITSDGKVRVPDGGKFVVGDGDDLQIFHGSNISYVANYTGELIILNQTDDSDVSIHSDNGSGGTAAYFRADGSTGDAILYHYGSHKLNTSSTGINVVGTINADGLDIDDNAYVKVGTGDDLQIYHNGTHSYIDHVSSGALIIRNTSNDVDVVIESDDGSGGLANYFRADGSTGDAILYHYGAQRLHTNSSGVNVVGTITADGLDMNDSEKILLGTGDDLEIFHNGGQVNESFVDNKTGNLNIRNFADDKDITIQSDNGSGGLANYIFCDGSSGRVVLSHYGSGKIETSSTGAKVTGALEVTQEYPSIRPTLDLNFAATKTLDRRITFIRDSIGTYTDENGLVKYASNNVPRFDHDPATGESLGLLIEENRTNDARNSSDFSSTRSASAYGDKSSVNTNVTTAPDGTLTADQIVTVTSSTQNRLAQSHSVTSGSYYTYSVFIKYDNLDNVQFYLGYGGHLNTSASFTFSTETITGGGGTAAFVKYPNGWYRISFTGQAFSTGSAYSGFISGTTANLRVYVWGEQIEVGSFPTSYIPTGSSAITRDDDDAVIKGTNFSDIYNETEGTIFAEFNTKVNTGTTSKWALSLKDPANNNNYIAVKTYSSNLNALVVQSGGSNVANLSVNSSVVIDQFRRVAGSFKLNDFDAADGGTLLTGDTSGAMPTGITQMDIGRGWSNSDQKLEGHIKSIKYYRTKLPNAQLQGLTQQ